MNVDTFENIIFNLISCLKNSWWQIIDMKIKHLCSCLTHLSRHRRRRRPKIRVIKARLSHPETKQQDQLTQQETEEVLTWGGGGGGVPVCMWLWDEPAGSTLERHPVTVTVLSSSPVSVQMELDVPKPGFNFSWSGFSQPQFWTLVLLDAPSSISVKASLSSCTFTTLYIYLLQ